MKHRRELVFSIWGIALGIILLVSGSLLGTFTWHRTWWFHPIYFEPAWAYYLTVGLAWAGVIVLILGIFGFVLTLLSEFFDREKKTPQLPASPES
jgi:hypothetical protein